MMFPRKIAGLLLFCAAFLTAYEAQSDQTDSGLRLADPDVLEALRATDTPGLPKNLTPGERLHLRLPDPRSLPRVPPLADDLRTAAEFERNQAIIMRWGDHNPLLTEMIVPITTGDPLAKVLLVVSGVEQQNSASLYLGSAGANLERIEFLIAPSNSVWIRDYGPRFSSADNTRIIVDHHYNRPRPQDDQIPAAIAADLDEDLYAMPITHGGGNFHLFANGEAFMTELILNENPAYTEQDVIDLYAEYQGLDLTIVDALPQTFDSTQHLDMWFLPVDDRTVIIGDYNTPPPGVPAAPAIVTDVTEATATLMHSRGYTVLRTPGWRTGGTHYTYTNSVIVNELVLICQFNGYNTHNLQARAVYEQAFPDRTIVPVNCSSIIGMSGALHCIVKHMPDATFRFAVEPQFVEVCVPESGNAVVNVDIDVDMINSYQGEVQLSVDNLPAGVSSALDGGPVTDPESRPWILTIDDAAWPGNFEIVVSADDGNETRQMSFLLGLGAPPAGIDLLVPADGSNGIGLDPAFAWQELDWVTGYRIQLADDAGFGNLLLDEFTVQAGFTPAGELQPGTTHYWRVQGQHACGEGQWSEPYSFQTRFDPLADLAPLSFGFVAPEGGSDSALLQIANVGSGELEWTIDNRACTEGATLPWLSAAPMSGSVAAGDSQSVSILADAAALAPGSHAGALCVTTSQFDAPPVTLPVQFEVLEVPPAELAVSPLVLSFGELVEGDSATLVVTVSNVAPAGAADLALQPPVILAGQTVYAIDAAASDCAATLAPQAQCSVAITYSPQAVGVHGGVVQIRADDLPAVSVGLSGFAVPSLPLIFQDRFE